MGRGMKAGKKKKDKTTRTISVQEFNKQCREYERAEEKAKVEATQDATRITYALTFLALHHLYGSTAEDISSINDEIGKICGRIEDEDDDYGWMNVYKELADFEVYVDKVKYDENMNPVEDEAYSMKGDINDIR